MTFRYQIGLAGNFSAHRAKLESLLFARIDDLGIERAQIAILDDLAKPDAKSPWLSLFLAIAAHRIPTTQHSRLY